MLKPKEIMPLVWLGKVMLLTCKRCTRHPMESLSCII